MLQQIIQLCGTFQWTCEEDDFTEPFGAESFVEANSSEEDETLIEWLNSLRALEVGEETTLEFITMRRVN